METKQFHKKKERPIIVFVFFFFLKIMEQTTKYSMCKGCCFFQRKQRICVLWKRFLVFLWELLCFFCLSFVKQPHLYLSRVPLFSNSFPFGCVFVWFQRPTGKTQKLLLFYRKGVFVFHLLKWRFLANHPPVWVLWCNIAILHGSTKVCISAGLKNRSGTQGRGPPRIWWWLRFIKELHVSTVAAQQSSH